MSAVLKRITVEKAGVVEIHDPELEVGQVIWVSVDKDSAKLDRASLAERFSRLVEEIQSRPGADEVTDDVLQDVIDDARRNRE